METLDAVLTPVQPALPVVPPSPSILPELASDLIELAILDLEITEQDPRYKINMSRWHEFFDGFCHVCLAGVVMAQTMKLDVLSHFISSNCQISEKMSALNSFRAGYIVLGLSQMHAKVDGVEWSSGEYFCSLDIIQREVFKTLGINIFSMPMYERQPEAFKSTMLQIAGELRKRGF